MSSADRIRRRAERGWADTRRVARRAGSARPARRLFRGARRRDRAGWNRATSDAHEAMRASVRPADGSVAIVCVSMRPSLLGAVVGHVASQRDGGLTADPDVVFVANDAGFEDVAVRAAFDAVPNSTVIWPDEPLELGSALNLAMASTDARYVAKFDDDDRYGPAHLADALRAHSFAGAAVVGKHSYYAELVARSETVLQFPGNDHRYSAALAGGTLVIDRDRTGDLAFEEISLGEDQAFIRACHRRGWSTYSCDRFNFVQTRNAENTWRVSDELFMSGSMPVDLANERIMR